MGPKQAMALDLTTATRAELLKAESVLFRAKMKAMSGSPMQKEYNQKYWEVRAAMPDFSAIPKSQNGSLRFKSASERDTAFRMLKAARVKFPGVMQKAVDNRTGVYLILFPGASQLVTAAHWENAMETAGVQSNPKRKSAPKEYPAGTCMKFDGKAADGTAQGYFPVRVVQWNSTPEGYDQNGRHVLGVSTVSNERTGRVFEAYNHTLSPMEQNPQFTRPSLIGSVVDTYFPVDLMEGSVKGAVEDLKDLVGRGSGSGGRKRK